MTDTITFKGMQIETKRRENGSFELITEAGRYFILVNKAERYGWVASIWKHTNCFGGTEIVRTLTGARGRVTRRATARGMMRAALEAYGKPISGVAPAPKKTSTYPALTAEQTKALTAFVVRSGRFWKVSLRHAWEAGTVGPELQQLRNTHGPRWLAKFKFTD
jgi:hypothetical protein